MNRKMYDQLIKGLDQRVKSGFEPTHARYRLYGILDCIDKDPEPTTVEKNLLRNIISELNSEWRE